jgi:hypothetical protein
VQSLEPLQVAEGQESEATAARCGFSSQLEPSKVLRQAGNLGTTISDERSIKINNLAPRKAFHDDVVKMIAGIEQTFSTTLPCQTALLAAI